MRDLPLSLLRSLAVVRAEGGVRPAARRLAVEHSTVSRALHDLEKWIGAPIIEPRSRGQRLRLTPEGEALADKALAALHDLEHATARLREARSNRRVVIAAPPSIANRWLLPRLPRIEAACAGVELSIVVDTVRMGELDPYADLSLRMGACTISNAKIDTIGSDIAFPVVGTEAWTRLGRPTDMEALRLLPLLHDRDMRTAWVNWREMFGPSDLDVRTGPRLTSADLVLRAVEQGRGFALTRGWLAEDALADGLLTRPFGDACLQLENEWWVAQTENASPTRHVCRVRDWLIEEGRVLGPPR